MGREEKGREGKTPRFCLNLSFPKATHVYKKPLGHTQLICTGLSDLWLKSSETLGSYPTFLKLNMEDNV